MDQSGNFPTVPRMYVHVIKTKFSEATKLHLQIIMKIRPCSIQTFSSLKIEIFIGKKIDFLYIFAQNIDCGYILETPR